MKSLKQQKIEEFHDIMIQRLREAGAPAEDIAMQLIPAVATDLTKRQRVLRAKLIYEECLETIKKGLGVSMYTPGREDLASVKMSEVDFEADGEFNMIELADGLGDMDVVVGGTYVVAGLKDQSVFNEVHRSNMTKFPEGYNGLNEYGKWVKPDSFEPPQLGPVIGDISSSKE